MSGMLTAADLKDAGVEYEVGDDYTLQLDMDSPEAIEKYPERYMLLLAVGLLQAPIEEIKRPSHTPGHFHYILRLSYTLLPERRVLLQALLGSDPKREACNLYRIECGIPEPIVLAVPGWKNNKDPLVETAVKEC